MKQYQQELIVFFSGMIVMMLELVGSRLLAPYIGTSIFVWTSLIGVILGCLSLGYWIGGKLADKDPHHKTLALIIFSAGIFVALTAVFNKLVLAGMQSLELELRISTVLLAIILFGPASVLLGMVSPYALRLKLMSLGKTGRTAGNLYALSTLGSIAGTFLAGFFLISYLGTITLIYVLALSLFLLSLVSAWRFLILVRILFILLATVLLYYSIQSAKEFSQRAMIDVDTAYSRVLIYEDTDHYSGKRARFMRIGNDSSSAMFLDSDELVYPYTRYYRLAKHFSPGLQRALMIGGAGYSYPKDFLAQFPSARMDVVEIDPEVTELAKEYFHLKPDPRLSVIHEDARTFLNTSNQRYDVIFGDAFQGQTTPFQLTTIEATRKMAEALTEDGVVIVNLISSLQGEKSRFFQAEYATYQAIFPQVYAFAVQFPGQPEVPQNIVLIALKSKNKPSFKSQNPELQLYLDHVTRFPVNAQVPVLTDNYAPVELYTSPLFLTF